MRLKSFSLRGLWGVSPEKPLVIENFGAHTVLIGPNNSGKSIPQRFFFLLRQLLEETAIGQPSRGSIDNYPVRMFWQDLYNLDATCDISFLMKEDSVRLPASNRVALVNANEFRISIHLQRTDAHLATTLVPMVFDGEWKPLFKGTGTSADPLQVVTDEGGYRAQELVRERIESVAAMIERIKGGMLFFDVVRALHRQGSEGAVDGSRILGTLYEWRDSDAQAGTWRRFRSQFVEILNSLFVPCGMAQIEAIDLKEGTPGPQMTFDFLRMPSPVSVESMGAGVSQMVIVLASLLMAPDSTKTVLIEEPEGNLHPALLNRFVRLLKRFPQWQFVFTSHSSVILDALTQDDAVYHFTQDASDGSCSCKPCKQLIDKHAVLDSLGVSGAFLLQANCVIWVEGPSDRLYVREWIRMTDPSLVEGSDFAFAFYGGSILSHFSLGSDDDPVPAGFDAEDLIEMVRICRHSVVLMDRDCRPTEEPREERKHRILAEANGDRLHRKAFLSLQWEVENDIGKKLLGSALRAVSGRENDLANFEPDGQQPYEDEVVAALGLSGEDAKRMKRKLTDKVALAKRALALAAETQLLEVPAYIPELVAFIIASRHE